MIAVQLTETHQSILVVASSGIGLARPLFQYALEGLFGLLWVILCLLLCFGDAGGGVLLRHDDVRREGVERDAKRR